MYVCIALREYSQYYTSLRAVAVAECSIRPIAMNASWAKAIWSELCGSRGADWVGKAVWMLGF